MALGEVVGRLDGAWVYPVKGMQGVSMDDIAVRSVSVVGDRRVAFTEIGSKGTPTLLDTVKFPGLLRYSARFDNPLDPGKSEIVVTTPQGRDYAVGSPLLLDQISHEAQMSLAVVRMGRAAYHSMPVSMISFGTVRETDSQVGSEVDPRAYRQNLYIETKLGLPYEEDGWIGKVLVFGDSPNSAKLVIVKPDPRCATVNYHPQTAESNPNVLRAIVQNHNNTLGVYCAIVGEGRIEANSPVYLSSTPI
ncbi:MAG: hypothetical protein ACD_37C00604G0002 [uncultured bacterium]|nr:MAG: hypothetical protein ACD_37C00604G0002 [uncultured bacterium]